MLASRAMAIWLIIRRPVRSRTAWSSRGGPRGAWLTTPGPRRHAPGEIRITQQVQVGTRAVVLVGCSGKHRSSTIIRTIHRAIEP